MNIHPSAVVSPSAHLGRNVSVGPFCIIEDDAHVGDGCALAGHVVIKSGTTLGPKNTVAEGTVLGGMPQHAKAPGDCGRLVIGQGNTIRENVTIHRSLYHDRQTTVGDGNLIMVNAHIAHDCILGNQTIIANNVMLAGHIEINDRAYLSGAVGIHQFCRVGKLAMVGGQARVVKDVPPYVTIDGESTRIVGLNLVGLRRAGFDRDQITELKAAYRVIYRSGLKWTEVQEQLAARFTAGPAADFHSFFSSGQRGFTPERAVPSRATLKLRPVAGEPDNIERKAG